MADMDDLLVTSGPVCLVRQNGPTLELCDEGLDLLLSYDNLPIAAITVAGLYRTGKSFFLNQLAGTHGFKVGSTIQSCTRGIWMWPVSSKRWQSKEHPNARLVLFDTEGLASMDNDDNYDARIFALGILLSSFFVYNSMGVIDESAIDRLLLVSELTKSICMSSSGDGENEADEDGENSTDQVTTGAAMSESQHAEFFPPFLWLLRDFSLQLERDGKVITEQDYLEQALEDRPGATSRVRDHNQVRQSFRSLFKDRECRTLIRPVTNESDLHQLADLSRPGFRPEFLEQLDGVTNSVLSKVQPKTLFGRPITGHMLASLARSFVGAINSGVVPDIKKGYEYMVDESFRCAFEATLSFASTQLRESVIILPLMTRSEFDTVDVKIRREAVGMFHTKSSVGGSGVAAVGTSGQRAHWTTKLSEELDKVVADALHLLETQSQTLCQNVAQTSLSTLRKFIESGAFDHEPSGVVSAVQRVTQSYVESASGPAVQSIGFKAMSTDWMVSVGQALQRVEHVHTLAEQEHVRALENEQQERRRTEQALEANEDKLNMVRGDNERLVNELANQTSKCATLDTELKDMSTALDTLRLEHVGVQRDLESAQEHIVREREQATEVATRLATNLEAMSDKLERLSETHSETKDELNAVHRENDGLQRDVEEGLRIREQDATYAATRYEQMEVDAARQRNEYEGVVEKLEQAREANLLLQERLSKAHGDGEQAREHAERQREEMDETIRVQLETILSRDNTIQESRDECQRLQDALEEEDATRTRLEHDLEDVKRDGSDLSQDLQTTRTELHDVQEVVRERNEQVETMRTELRALRDLTEEQEKKFGEVLRGVEDELSGERAIRKEMEAHNTLLQTSLDDLTQQYTDEGSDLQERINAQIARESELIEQVTKGKQICADRDEQLADVRTELESLRGSSEEQRVHLESEREDLIGQLKTQTKSNTELLDENKELNGSIAQLKDRVQQLESDVVQGEQAAGQRADGLEAELKDLQAKLADTLQESEQAEQAADQRIKLLESEVQALDTKLTETEQHVAQSKEAAGQRVQVFENELQAINAKLMEAEQQIVHSEQTAGQRANLLEREVQALHAKLAETQRAAQEALQAKELSTIAHNDVVALADEERKRVTQVELNAVMEDMKIKVKEQLQLDKAHKLEAKLRVIAEERDEIKHRLQVLIMQAAQLPDYLQAKLFASPDQNHVENW